jgi:hypothetical protein
VKNVLMQHLELDSEAILSVLCHQIIPPDEPMGEEHRVIREQLLGLVVAFLQRMHGSCCSCDCKTR